MLPEELERRFAALHEPADPGYFPLEVLARNLYLSRSVQGGPCLVLMYEAGARVPSGRRTRGLRLDFSNVFSFAFSDGTNGTGKCALLQCVDPDLTYYFWLMSSGLVKKADADAELLSRPSTVIDYLIEWQSLLMSRRELTFQEEIGLWGEIFFILQCPDPDGASGAWYGPASKTFDYSANGIDIDVKTSLQGHAHHLQLKQLEPSPSQGRRFIYSLHVIEDSAGGQSIDDLIRQYRSISRDPVPFEQMLLRMHYTEGTSTVRLTALGSLLVPVEDVPSVIPAPGVTQVQFVADLSGCPTLSDAEFKAVLQKLAREGQDDAR